MIDQRLFIPSLSPLKMAKIWQEVPRFSAPLWVVGLKVYYFVTPIRLKPGDLVCFDPRSNKIEAIERDGIVIWRASLLN